MRRATIELSGSEMLVLKETLEIMKDNLGMEEEELSYRIQHIEKILFGAGPE
jgi:hypothetical protein